MNVQTWENLLPNVRISLPVTKGRVKLKPMFSADFGRTYAKTTPFPVNRLGVVGKTDRAPVVRRMFPKQLRPADGNLRGADQHRERTAIWLMNI